MASQCSARPCGSCCWPATAGPTEPATVALVNCALHDAEPVVRFLPGGTVELGALAPGVTGARAPAGHRLHRYDRRDLAAAQGMPGSDMAACGSRAKMRAYYRRRHPTAADQGAGPDPRLVQ
jgi:hypothetical protein